MQTRLENKNSFEAKDWTKFAFWCTPEGLGGEKIRFGLRKMVPLGLASLVGLSTNQFTIMILSNQAILLSLSIADLLATFTGVVAFGAFDTALERCWPTDYRIWQEGFQVFTTPDMELGRVNSEESTLGTAPQV